MIKRSKPEQKTNRPKQVAKLADITRGMNKTVRGWAGAGIAAILLILLAATIWHAPGKRLPEELLGEWRTTDPVYADRTFEMDHVCITFTIGEGTVSVGFIKDVKQIPDGNRILYTVSYIVDDVPNEVSFFYDPNNGKNLWFKNQEKVVWKKE